MCNSCVTMAVQDQGVSVKEVKDGRCTYIRLGGPTLITLKTTFKNSLENYHNVFECR